MKYIIAISTRLTPIKSYSWKSGWTTQRLNRKGKKTSYRQTWGEGTRKPTYIHPLAQTVAEGKVVWWLHNLRGQVFAKLSRQKSREWELWFCLHLMTMESGWESCWPIDQVSDCGWTAECGKKGESREKWSEWGGDNKICEYWLSEPVSQSVNQSGGLTANA